MECLSPEWLFLLPFAAATSGFIIFTFVALRWYALRQIAFALSQSDARSRGMWAFAVDDFRSSQLSWALIILARDLIINLVPVVFPGDGATQTTIVSYLCLIYGMTAIMVRPFVDGSNNAL